MKDELAPGTVIGGYRIERRLGSGGMGSVYLAQHPELPRHDALKVLGAGYEADDAFRKRFLREAELAARLDHDNIVTIYNRGRADDRLWIAMQYVEGDDCSVLLKKSPTGLPVDTAVHIVSQIARGLDYAHKAGLLHRDIKPANILVSGADDDGEPGRVLLTDFGVAKGGDDSSQLTVVGTVLATLAYASPEQLCGEPLDPRSDQYSLAATFFHLVAGKVPYAGGTTDAVIDAHFNAPPPRLSAIRQGISPAVDSVVARGLAKTPAERFGSCREFAAALRQAVATPRGSGRPFPPGSHPSGPRYPSGPGYPVPPGQSLPPQQGLSSRPGLPPQQGLPPQHPSAPQYPGRQPYAPASAPYRPQAPVPGRPSGAVPRPGRQAPGAPFVGPMAGPPAQQPQGTKPPGPSSGGMPLAAWIVAGVAAVAVLVLIVVLIAL
ncbi:protein kinase [Tsukamurella sp. 8F]|uniref:serine/threonine-protein kinase n=1 Tax=unclassified Tsukamurella TaxID=2633480 RepID=UPI0023B9C3FA|nr:MULTISPECIES: serine/threonine-protein kinase [unclassified Tsukamurella]MDF0532624.1 protein kinase [Tsukamurella sp. 8J]MDF0589513.1 protein kinase [Tsukamurella sp. 8F]